ncbi:hypothetical protein F4810DRAFT_226546 [Camillea tinctor]|nr:hypothetical protein F4810DRAFT_226546 [Camillea tinctor]
MGRGKKTKKPGKNAQRPGAQGQQHAANKSPNTPPKPGNNKKKCAIDHDAEGSLVSKLIKTDTGPQKRVPVPQPSPAQAKHINFETLSAEQGKDSGSPGIKKQDGIINKLRWSADIEKRANESIMGDKILGIDTDLDDLMAMMDKFRKQAKAIDKQAKAMQKEIADYLLVLKD